MSDFNKVTPVVMAFAMSAGSPEEAVEFLCKAAEHKAEYSLDCLVVTWHATSLPVRHGLLMEWLAAEASL